ncbi:unnamed protein product [Pedinophyceae sp. YPF-701]|nr:unnamed protein product [Pedinophyceae sp. YPF-701]
MRELAAKKQEEEEINAPVVSEIPDFSAPLSVIKYPDPRLRATNADLSPECFDDPRLQELAQAMFEVMYDDDGVGLAAPQVGVNVRLMVFNEVGERGKGEEVVLINPRIVTKSKKQVLGEEGCLSFPGIYGDVKRSQTIKVRAVGVDGKKIVLDLKGYVARIFQHEYDHLQGKLFPDRMSPEVFKTVRGECKAMEEVYLKDHPDTEIKRYK